MYFWEYYRFKLSHPGLGLGLLSSLLVCVSCAGWNALAPSMILAARKVRKTTLNHKMAFLSWQTQDTLDLVFTPADSRNFSPSFSRLSLDSVPIRMMYGCGLFRRGGIDGGTLITINRAGDFKQNHTPVKVLFFLSVWHAKLLLGFTQVCMCAHMDVSGALASLRCFQ